MESATGYTHLVFMVGVVIKGAESARCQECMMTSFLLRREEEERVTSHSGRGENRISHVYYK